MILEQKYQRYLKDEAQEFVLRIKMGLVDFGRNVVIKKSKGLKIEVSIRRTDNNDRQRADSGERHGRSVLIGSGFYMNLVDLRDFEWLAWNYRTYKL